MNVLRLYFDRSVNQCSPSRGDLERCVHFDDAGSEVVTYEPVDYRALVVSHGTVNDWTLENLLKAGIDPSFPISTGSSTRLGAFDDLQSISASLEKLDSDNA